MGHVQPFLYISHYEYDYLRMAFLFCLKTQLEKMSSEVHGPTFPTHPQETYGEKDV